MSFTDQKPRIVKEEDLKTNWEGYKDGSRFRCYLCGHSFQLNDQYRFVYTSETYLSEWNNKVYALSNLFVCKNCDGPNEQVIEKWKKLHEEVYSNRFWWLHTE